MSGPERIEGPPHHLACRPTVSRKHDSRADKRILARAFSSDQERPLKPAEVQPALEAVEAGDARRLEPLLKTNPALVHQILEHDGHSVMLRPTLLHRTNARADRERRPRRRNKGDLDCARLLIDCGADINSRVLDSLPPLEMAAWTRHHDLFELLLANGADVECHTELPPIEVAVATGYGRDMFKSLAAAGAQYDISHTLRLGLLRETRTLLEADPSLANTETDHGLPLNLAVSKPGSYKPSPGLFKLLIRFGADIHAEDRFGLTPLKAARLPGNDRIVLALLDMGVEDDIYGALLARDEERVRAILRADPSQAHPVAAWPDRGPPPPIIWAVWSGSTRLVKMILEHDVALNMSGDPLGIAIQYRYDEIVRLLLDHGASPECGDCSGWAGVRTGNWDRVPGGGPAPDDDPPVSVPLYTALRNGTTAAVEMLLDAGADPNSTLTMWSGLQWPARDGDLDRVRLLLKRGGNPASHCARRALRLATRLSREAVVELLVTHGVDAEAATDSELDEEKIQRTANESTRGLLEELRGILGLPRRKRARILRLRAQLIDAVIDGDAGSLRDVQQQAPELLERPVVKHDLLNHAAMAGHGDVVDVLVECGAPMTIQTATTLGRLDLVASMLDSDPTLANDDPAPLKIAARKNHRALAELLLDRGADIDRVSSNYQPTALHVAVGSRSIDVLKLLLSRGADVTIRETGDHHHTPLGVNWPLTVPEGEEIRDLLIASGAKPEEQHSYDA